LSDAMPSPCTTLANYCKHPLAKVRHTTLLAVTSGSAVSVPGEGDRLPADLIDDVSSPAVTDQKSLTLSPV
jgi:hypothetical protein